jgi:hypothetical protein
MKNYVVGAMFKFKLITEKKSPLIVKGVNTKLKKTEILEIHREIRER